MSRYNKECENGFVNVYFADCSVGRCEIGAFCRLENG